MDKSTITAELLKIGMFHDRALPLLGINPDDMKVHLNDYPSDMIFNCEDGWTVIADENNIAMNTILRIAGALNVSPLPLSDISKSLIKMMSWGKTGTGKVGKQSLGYYIADKHESLPSKSAVKFLSKIIGGDVSGYETADFSTAHTFIRPVGIEVDLLAKLNLTTHGFAPSSWICRRLDSRPARTTVDGSIVPSIPFVLTSYKSPIRLIGRNIKNLKKNGQKESSFIGMARSKDGKIISLEYKVSAELVEGNSFNISPQCRSNVAGDYREVNTGNKLYFNMDSKDCRKFSGIGPIIRKSYPDYEDTESAFVFLDKENGLATVEIGVRHERRFEERCTHIMDNGISSRTEYMCS